jgi:hypothetical protein
MLVEASLHPLRPFGPPPPSRGRRTPRSLALSLQTNNGVGGVRLSLADVEIMAGLAPSSPSTGEVAPKATEGVMRRLRKSRRVEAFR